SLLSFSFSAAQAASSGDGSRITSAKRLPSGDHSNECTLWSVLVSFCASPPIRFSSHTCVFPSLRSERNARYLPSGLQRGVDDDTPSAVMGMASPTLVGTIQICSSYLSFFMLAFEIV